ncbi:MAG: hypothetical protein PHT44_00605 [Candidatus Portnoybacteria bacterium]|nr:hypothetical protein [Candidatus Portnoybacteria bacterium]MDD4982885.1 hypothetical protein [Candidatus Portnoybacteria bacterium]
MAIIPNGVNKELNIETQQRKKTEQMSYLLVLIVIVAAVFLYLGIKGDSSPAKTGAPDADAAQTAQDNKLFDGLRKADLENMVFKEKKFEALTQNGEFPVSIGQRGRENPFAPY